MVFVRSLPFYVNARIHHNAVHPADRTVVALPPAAAATAAPPVKERAQPRQRRHMRYLRKEPYKGPPRGVRPLSAAGPAVLASCMCRFPLQLARRVCVGRHFIIAARRPVLPFYYCGLVRRRAWRAVVAVAVAAAAAGAVAAAAGAAPVVVAAFEQRERVDGQLREPGPSTVEGVPYDGQAGADDADGLFGLAVCFIFVWACE